MSYNNLLSRNLISGILESREIYACIDAVMIASEKNSVHAEKSSKNIWNNQHNVL